MPAASDSPITDSSDKPRHCSVFRPLLSDYVDGEATATEAALVEEHLTGCAACTSHLAFLKAATRLAAAAMPEIQPPSELFARIAAATYRRPTLRDRIFGVLRPVPVRAALGSAFALTIAALVVGPRLANHQESGVNRSQTPLAQTKPSASPPAPFTAAARITKPVPKPMIAANRTEKPSGKTEASSKPRLVATLTAPLKPRTEASTTAETLVENSRLARLAAQQAKLRAAVEAMNAAKPGPVQPLVAIIRPRSSFALMNRSRPLPSQHPSLLSPSGERLAQPASSLEPEQHRAIAATVPVSAAPMETTATGAAETVISAPPRGLGSGLLVGAGTGRSAPSSIASRGNRETAMASNGNLALVQAPVN